MDEVEQMPDSMSKSQDSSAGGSLSPSLLKMSTSESEQSLLDCHHDSHQSLLKSHQEPNRAVIFMSHCSEDNDGVDHDNDGDYHDDDDDSDGLPVIGGDKFNRNYFTMTYTDNGSSHEDGLNNNEDEDKDWLDTSLSPDIENEEDLGDGEEEDDDNNTTLVPSTSAKKSLMKLFSPDKLPLRKLQMESQEKLSPMDVSDISSPDSHKSLSEDLTAVGMGYSLSEDSLTYIVDCRAREVVKEEGDSLDEISSGEISEDNAGAESEDRQSNASQNLSELWDNVSPSVFIASIQIHFLF